jgi:hypothetical protein
MMCKYSPAIPAAATMISMSFASILGKTSSGSTPYDMFEFMKLEDGLFVCFVLPIHSGPTEQLASNLLSRGRYFVVILVERHLEYVLSKEVGIQCPYRGTCVQDTLLQWRSSFELYCAGFSDDPLFCLLLRKLTTRL